MTNRELRNTLLDLLAAELASDGFVLTKAAARFTKKLPDGWHQVQLVFLVRSAGWEIKPGLLLRKHVVETIYHQASYFEAKYHRTTATIGLPLEKLAKQGPTASFDLTTEADITSLVHELGALFRHVALPFFAQYDQLAAIDQELNKEAGESLFSWPNRGSIGLIIAHLVANARYEQLEKQYRTYYQQLSNGFYLPEYEGVVEVLKKGRAKR
jgi:hypothetical protein